VKRKKLLNAGHVIEYSVYMSAYKDIVQSEDSSLLMCWHNSHKANYRNSKGTINKYIQ
jgi:hypothetical protein